MATESVGTKPAVKPLWTAPNEQGYSYADWGRVSREEPTVLLGLTQTKGSRRQDNNFNYYAVESKFGGFRISRKQRIDVAPAPPPPVVAVAEQKTLATPLAKQNGFEDTKSAQIKALHDENLDIEKQKLDVEREHIKAIRELVSALQVLTVSINNKVLK